MRDGAGGAGGRGAAGAGGRGGEGRGVYCGVKKFRVLGSWRYLLRASEQIELQVCMYDGGPDQGTHGRTTQG